MATDRSASVTLALLVATLAALAAAALPLASAAAPHDVYLEASRSDSYIGGAISFTVTGGSSTVNGVTIDSGDSVTVEFGEPTNQATVYLNGDLLYLSAVGARVYVNGTLIADWDDTNPNGFTLYLTVADVSSNITTGLTGDDSGYTRLDVDGRNIIYSQASSDQVDVDGVEPDSSGYLYLSYHPSNSQLVVDATASSIVVNGQPVPILAVGGALAASAVLLAYALSGRRPRGASRGEG